MGRKRVMMIIGSFLCGVGGKELVGLDQNKDVLDTNACFGSDC